MGSLDPLVSGSTAGIQQRPRAVAKCCLQGFRVWGSTLNPEPYPNLRVYETLP